MKGHAVGLALTWDGARWPVSKLPARARAFLRGTRALPAARMAAAFRKGEIGEVRICWVPRLRGGTSVLCDPFTTQDGRRIAFRMRRMVRFGKMVGVVYSPSTAGRVR